MYTLYAVVRTLEPGCAEAQPSQGLETFKWLLCNGRLFILSVDPLRYASDLPDTYSFWMIWRYTGLWAFVLNTDRLITLVLGAPCSALIIIVVIVKLLETADEAELLSRLSKQWTYIRKVPRSNLRRNAGYRKTDSSCFFPSFSR